MKFFQKASDGGKDSGVTAYFLVEIKSLFSITLLHFEPSRREAFHSHAFNAVTLWLKGVVVEEVRDKRGIHVNIWTAGRFKYTPRELMHRIKVLRKGAWALSIRGSWQDQWQEYHPSIRKVITLTHGRKQIN